MSITPRCAVGWRKFEMTDEGLYSVFRRPAERSRKLDFIEETDPREDFVGYYLVVEQATGREGGGFAFDE